MHAGVGMKSAFGSLSLVLDRCRISIGSIKNVE
jgi:hypothetical protein